jgi:histidyl-tRNA synthetase
MSFRPPKGTDDLLAPRSQSWREAMAAWEDWSARYGYPLVATPVMEATELFMRGVGATTEVVTKQMFTFTDRGGRSMTLRPEGTAGVVRAFLDSGLQGAWKGAYSGPFFRYEQPQGGRRRQFWQLGVEYLNVVSPVADAEVVELGYRYLEAVGVPDLELRVNSLGDANCRPRYVAALRAYLVERRQDLSPDAARLIEVNPLRVLDSKGDRPALPDPPHMSAFLCADCADHYQRVKGILDRLGIPHTQDETLVRGLDYYTRTAFEYIGRGLSTAQNAVGGGGRYDGLAEAIGGSPTPGVGFALGLDRVILSAGRVPPTHLDAYLVSETSPEETIGVVSALRRQGLRVDFDGEGRPVEAQFKTASRLGVPVVLVYSGGERPISVRTVEARLEMAVEDVAAWIRGDRDA